MKLKTMFFLFVILNANLVMAQSKDFPTSASWVYNMGDSAPTTSNAYYSISGDSIVNGTIYQNVYRGQHIGFVRTEEKKVFFLPKDSIQFFLIYDFSLVEGDTFISHLDMQYGMDTFYVSEIDSILTKDGFRKRWSFENALGSAYDHWIEGIGTEYDHFFDPRLGVFSSYDRLICFNNEGNWVIQDTVYLNTVPQTLVSCGGVIVSSEESLSNSNNKIKISPNPFINQIEILDPKIPHGTSIQIFSLLGELVQIISYDDQINISDLPSGTYLLSFRLENKKYSSLLQKL